MNAFRQQASGTWPGDLARAARENSGACGVSKSFLPGVFHRDSPGERLGAAGGEFRVRQPATGDQARLTHGKKIKQWVFSQRNQDRIAEAKELLSGDW
jgi:hypothetical protein